MTVGANLDATPKPPVVGRVAFGPMSPSPGGVPKHRMVIVCCGCGGQIDLPAVSVLVQDEMTSQEIVYRAACPACGFTHRIRVSQ